MTAKSNLTAAKSGHPMLRTETRTGLGPNYSFRYSVGLGALLLSLVLRVVVVVVLCVWVCSGLPHYKNEYPYVPYG